MVLLRLPYLALTSLFAVVRLLPLRVARGLGEVHPELDQLTTGGQQSRWHA